MNHTDLFSLDGKVAVVVGGGGVLAGAMAEGLAEAGAAIAIFDPHEANGEARAASIRARGAQAIAVQGDASRKEDLERALSTVLDSLGSVDILVNAAGINSGTPFFEITEAEWQRILDVNLKSVFLACQVFGKVWWRSGEADRSSTYPRSPPGRRCRRCSRTASQKRG